MLAAAVLGACGGTGSGATGIAGWRSFDVSAALKLTPTAGDEGSWTTFPTAATLTAAWNETMGVAVTGANGVYGGGSLARADGGMLQSAGWAAGVSFADGCGGTGTLIFDQVTFSAAGDTLAGSATGRALYVTSGAMMLEAAVTATLAGAPDATPPTLTAPGDDADPLQELLFKGSEPLSNGTLSLLGAPAGDVTPLMVHDAQPATSAAAVAFSNAGVALRYDETYSLRGALTDFAGNPAAPFQFKTRAAPPLVPEDGFESVTGSMFAGAAVLQGGPLPPISGQTSLMLNTGFGGGFGFLPYDLGPSMAVRLAVAPGDTVIRFAMRLIAADPVDRAAFDGVVLTASPGGSVAASQDLGATEFTRTSLPSLGDVFFSPVRTIEMPLPADARGEIAFEIVGRTFACTRPPSPTVLVIDDLRVE
jgi:hypothetical protein